MVCSVVNLRPHFGHDKADDETGFRQSGHVVNFGARSDRSSGVVGPKIQSRTSFAFISFLSFLPILRRLLGEHALQMPYKIHNSGGCARGSRSFAVAVLGLVTNGPPSIGVTFVKATSGISLGKPSSGNSFRNGKNGYPSHIRMRRRSGCPLNLIPIMS